MWHGQAQIGDACSDGNACVQVDGPPVFCESNGVGQVCVAEQFLEGGDDCESFTDPSCDGTCACAPWLVCGGTSSTRPVCTDPRVPYGTPCRADGDCGADSRCTCPIDDGEDADGDTCASFVCQPYPAIGQPCWNGLDGKQHCAAGGRCDSNQCVAAKDLGATCASDDDCASGRCQSVCIPGGIVDPLTCSGIPNPNVYSPFAFLAPSPTSTSTDVEPR